MKIDEYDDIEKRIYDLHDIVSIDFRDLEALDNDKHSIIPGFIVIYDGLKTLYLTVHDKHFNIFVRRLREVYLKEKDNVVTDVLGVKKGIEINKITKKILLEGSLEVIDDIYRFYDKKRSFDKSLLIMDNEMKMLLPIMKYHLEEILKLFEFTITYGNKLKGYHGTFNIDGIFNGVPVLIPFTFQKNAFNSYTFMIGGLLNKATPILINITFLERKIIVETKVEEYSLVDYRTYGLTNKGLDEEVYIYFNEALKKVNRRSLNKTTCPYDNLVCVTRKSPLEWYLLPWNGMYGCVEEYEEISESENFISSRGVYFDINDENFIIKDNFSKVYKRDSSALIMTRSVPLDESSKSVIGILRDGLVIIETSFDINGNAGYYKEYLGGRYFYHGCINSNLEGITNADFISLGENINDKSDLLRTENIRKLVKGGK